MSAGVVVPAYNAGRTLAGVLARIPRVLEGTEVLVWVVDDGSTDHTAAEAREVARRRPAVTLLRQPRNQGYGAAVRRGLEQARAAGVEAAACVHADGQYAPEELPALLATLRRRQLDVLQGSRIASGTALSGGMPLYKYVANRALTILENRVYCLALSDYHSGYLLYSRRALERLPLDRFSASFDFDLEVIACARAVGLAVGERPVPTRYADEVSHLCSIPYGLRALRVMARYLTGGYRGVAA